MAESKNRASKADVQSTQGNRMPAPGLDTESAAEIAYGSEQNKEQHSAFNRQQPKSRS